MEQRWIALGLGQRHGFVVGLERLSGVKRATLNGWFQRSSTPRLDALGAVARVLQVERSSLVAVFDGVDPADVGDIPDVVTDAERRRRRKWWLRVARETTPMLIGPANDAFGAAGFRSGRGPLVTLFEDYQSRLEPNADQLRALARIYRVPVRAFIDLWNNPPPTDEEAIALRRGVAIAEVDAEPPAQAPAARPERRRKAS